MKKIVSKVRRFIITIIITLMFYFRSFKYLILFCKINLR